MFIYSKIFHECSVCLLDVPKPAQIEYYLTEKGEMFEPILKLLGELSLKYEPAIIFKDRKPRDFEHVFGRNVRLSSVYDY
jgi:hypothetical protein